MLPGVDVLYAGVVIARSVEARDSTPDGLFLAVPDPMPVGTVLEISVGDGGPVAVRVDRVVESPDASLAGMRLRYLDGAPEIRLRSAAPPVAPPAPAPPAASAPKPVPESVPNKMDQQVTMPYPAPSYPPETRAASEGRQPVYRPAHEEPIRVTERPATPVTDAPPRWRNEPTADPSSAEDATAVPEALTDEGSLSGPSSLEEALSRVASDESPTDTDPPGASGTFPSDSRGRYKSKGGKRRRR